MGSPEELHHTIDQLNTLSMAEYGTSFAQALTGQPEELYVRRFARLGGIELKKGFADPSDLDPSLSVTGARRKWEFKSQLRDEANALKAELMPQFGALSGTASLELQKDIYKTLNGTLPTLPELAKFLLNAQNESVWFSYLLKAVQKQLCDRKGNEKHFQEILKEAATHITVISTEEILTKYLEPIVSYLTEQVPWLSNAPHVVLFAASFLFIHYAKIGFCSHKFDTELIRLLSEQNEFENK